MSRRRMRCGGLCSAALAAMVAMALTVTPVPPAGASSSGQAGSLTADNFWLTTATGDLYAFGVPSYGSPGGAPLNKPIVSMVPTRNQLGYWMAVSYTHLPGQMDLHPLLVDDPTPVGQLLVLGPTLDLGDAAKDAGHRADGHPLVVELVGDQLPALVLLAHQVARRDPDLVVEGGAGEFADHRA